MNREILEEMKQYYNDVIKISSRDFSEIVELKMNPTVQRYLNSIDLIEELKKNPNVQRYLNLIELANSGNIMYYGEVHPIGEVIHKYGDGQIKETNNIWCFLFERKAKELKGSREIFFYTSDENEIMVVYRDLEDSTRYKTVRKAEKEEFEKTHKVVYGKPDIDDYEDRYYNTRYHFFEDCITGEQEGKETPEEAAVRKILSGRQNG